MMRSVVVYGPDGRDPREAWEERLRRIDIEVIAKTHGIADVARLRIAIGDAAQAYSAAQFSARYGGPDRLDKIDEPIGVLLALVGNDVNQHRLFAELFEAGGLAVAEGFAELPRLLETLREAARKAHRSRGKGRPALKDDLRAAYQVFVHYWPLRNGDRSSGAPPRSRESVSPTSPPGETETVTLCCYIPGG
jgi:hypothetical protein